jgi:hypothetical protein
MSETNIIRTWAGRPLEEYSKEELLEIIDGIVDHYETLLRLERQNARVQTMFREASQRLLNGNPT